MRPYMVPPGEVLRHECNALQEIETIILRGRKDEKQENELDVVFGVDHVVGMHCRELR